MEIPAIWISSIIYSSLITVLSIGFTLTYLTAKIPNFAHGTYAGVGIYISFTLSRLMFMSPYVSIPISFILGGVMSVAIFVIVIGTLQRIGGGAIVLTISTLAIQIFMTAMLNVYTFWVLLINRLYTSPFILRQDDIIIGGLPGIFPFSVIFCVVSVIVLSIMLTRTKIGIAMRATAEDTQLASVLGINIYRIQLFSWFLTGGLACLAGSLIPMWFSSAPTTGAAMTTTIMAGSLLGGLDNIYGAIFGGFIVGFSEQLLTYFLVGLVGVTVGEYRPLIPMIILIIVLLFEPRGLNGVYERLKARGILQRTKAEKSKGEGSG